MRYLYSLWFSIFSWKIEGSVSKDLKKYIIIVVPHTSNLDFFMGIMTRSLLHIQKAKYLAKSQLFKPPFGFIFSLLGGYPVDRSKNNNLVDAVVDIYNSKDEFAIAIAPEGTRKKVPKLKKGFYYIAQKAHVPIVMIGFDYGRKTIRVSQPFYTSDDIVKDFKDIIDFFSECKGINPELGVDQNTFIKMKPELEKIKANYNS